MINDILDEKMFLSESINPRYKNLKNVQNSLERAFRGESKEYGKFLREDLERTAGITVYLYNQGIVENNIDEDMKRDGRLATIVRKELSETGDETIKKNFAKEVSHSNPRDKYHLFRQGYALIFEVLYLFAYDPQKAQDAMIERFHDRFGKEREKDYLFSLGCE